MAAVPPHTYGRAAAATENPESEVPDIVMLLTLREQEGEESNASSHDARQGIRAGIWQARKSMMVHT